MRPSEGRGAYPRQRRSASLQRRNEAGPLFARALAWRSCTSSFGLRGVGRSIKLWGMHRERAAAPETRGLDRFYLPFIADIWGRILVRCCSASPSS